jgi:PAS domain S-box-containing protein
VTEVEQLLGVVGLLHSGLELPSILRRISEVARDSSGGVSAGVVGYRGEGLELLALAGTDLVEERIPFAYEGSAIAAMDLAGTDFVDGPVSRYPLILEPVREGGLEASRFAAARIVVQGRRRGGLYLAYGDAVGELAGPERLMLQLLAAHAGAALAHATVVQQRQRGRAILAGIADGVAVVDQAGLVVWCNPAAARITGVTQPEAIGRPLPFPMQAHGVEYEHQLAGSWLEAVCSPMPDHDPPETVVTFRDITAAKMVEEAKNLFLATTGHELRTPLTVIRGFAGTLMNRWDALSDAERQEAVRIIGARADGLGVLVEQVLANSHAEAGARRLERVPLDLGPIMTTAAVDIGSLSDKHDVTVELPGGLPRVLADEQALRTILGHLVDNAAKYSPGGGVVALSAAVNADGRSVAVRVDDEGIGVAHEDQERVFERFFQADGGDTRQRGGFGLGLYIVRRLVQAHEGTVTMSRRPDGRPGSRVELCLPVAPNL